MKQIFSALITIGSIAAVALPSLGQSAWPYHAEVLNNIEQINIAMSGFLLRNSDPWCVQTYGRSLQYQKAVLDIYKTQEPSQKWVNLIDDYVIAASDLAIEANANCN
jgi:hypothetical protein